MPTKNNPKPATACELAEITRRFVKSPIEASTFQAVWLMARKDYQKANQMMRRLEGSRNGKQAKAAKKGMHR
jgi:hypothetical protein